MYRPRITSAVSETWGNKTVYTYDPSDVDAKPSAHAIHHTQSNISEVVEELNEPEEDVANDSCLYLMTSLFAAVLEDVISQMWILERCNNGLSILKTLADINHLRAIKYGVYNPNETKDELDGIDPHNLNCVIYKIKKLDADRKYINNVIVATYLALAQSFNYKPLIKHINEIEERERHRIDLEAEESKNRILRKELGRQVRQQHNHIKTVIYDTDVIIDKLRTQVEDSVLFSEVRGRYIDNWQQARTEQHNQTISDIENKPLSTIEAFKQRSDHELRIHTEVELLVTIAINETLARIEEWMDKYDKDMEKIDLQIQIKKNDYQNMRDRRIELEEKIARHDEKMKNWINFKDEREKARAYREKMTTSAIIVQAWWRGLLVRLELGPFKPKKGKRAIDAKKKK
nr:dynein regulatory complex protein 9 isoform X1 [Helicoverpa armigera]